MRIPLLDVNAQNLPLESAFQEAFQRVIRSGRFILGPEVGELEEKIAELTGVRHAIGVSSGTDALLLALMTLEIGPGDEVLCPSFTFFATAGCIARTGATPVFVDSLESSFNIDVEDAARKVTSRTKAIIPVHLFGQMADMDAVMKLASDHDLAVIEDCAQSMGATCRGRAAGGIGTFGAFSFFPSKNLGGFGDGGMLVCDDDQLAERARCLRGHGSRPKYYHRYVGGNFRLDTLQAALLLVKLPHWRRWIAARRENAASYNEILKPFAANGLVHLPAEEAGYEHTWNQYTVRIADGRRDAIRQNMADQGVASEIYYPQPMDSQDCFRNLGQSGNCPVAARLANEVLSIPIYPELGAAGREAVVSAMLSSLETGAESRPLRV